MVKRIKLIISEQILQFIQKNNMTTGDALPSERHFAEIMKTSRNSVREALKKLEALEILEIKRGSGCYIKNPDIDQFINPETDIFLLAMQNIEARIAIEPGIIKLAAEKLKARDINQLENVIVRMSRAVLARDFPVIASEDKKFIEIIGSCTGNRILSSAVNGLLGSGDNLWSALSYLPDENLNSIFATYVKVLNNMQDRDIASSVRETEIRLNLMKKYLNQGKIRQTDIRNTDSEGK